MSETPAELILFDGEPDLSLIPDTNVLWATNTESDLFLSSHDGSYYYLVSGRWFRADDLMQGPWTFVSDRGVSLNVVYDRRDHPLNPESGVYGRANQLPPPEGAV